MSARTCVCACNPQLNLTSIKDGAFGEVLKDVRLSRAYKRTILNCQKKMIVWLKKHVSACNNIAVITFNNCKK
jgi:hypothetical protein